MTEERTYKVDMLARVEGEGRFSLTLEGDEVKHAHLAIFEAPRFFEAFLEGRTVDEVPDIVARICGICPVAYQMSAVRALEQTMGWTPPDEIRRLRRLLYCGEWIESHALHVFLLHAPDYLGYESAMAMARDHRPLVERGLQMKKAGNALIEVLGGRAIHPVSPRVGGFSKVPTRDAFAEVLPALVQALSGALETVAWAAGLPAPDVENDYVYVALAGAADYPLEWGDHIAISGRERIAVEAFGTTFAEHQVPYSNALQCLLDDGTPYLCGPMARLYHAAERLHPIAAQALIESELKLPCLNPYKSIVVRAVELVHAFAEALDIIDAYRRPAVACATLNPNQPVGHGATEAPRGLLYHRYEVSDEGQIQKAQIVPPTSQNQARIEADLVEMVPILLEHEHERATRLCEQLIRAYDPCISCATHFLRLDIERLAPGSDRKAPR